MTIRKRQWTSYIVIHCSATSPTHDVGVSDIRSWHLRRGWSDVGYHYVIRRDGRVEPGRAPDRIGAHVSGHNHHSVSVCLVGGVDSKGRPANNYTDEQWESLEQVVNQLAQHYPYAEVVGHRDLSPDRNRNGTVEPSEWVKACPCFDVRQWWATHDHTPKPETK